MKMSPAAVKALPVLLLWLVLSWFTGTWLHLHGPNLWMIRGGLALLGIAGFLLFIWLQSRPGKGPVGGEHGKELDLLLSEADSRLQASSLGRSAKIAGLPAIFLLGDSGTAKTSVVLRSGLEPELLAGQAYLGDAVAPTRSMNLWFARQWLLVDPAGGLFSDHSSRQGLIRRLAPLKIGSVMGGGAELPRVAVVCVDCESLLAAGAAEAMTARARALRETLGEISHLLGIRLPVYVLFTKMDRLAHFFEYAGNLTEEEAGQVFGATLPMAPDLAGGVYAERETNRLNEAFGNLTFSLCDHRPDFLAREHDGAKLPSIYEFPREFRKMRAVLVQFLVDLCRPSQLRTNPFLRGFYFTGVRPVTVSDIAAAAPAPQPQQQRPFDADATRVFVGTQAAPSPEISMQAPNVRRVPQWVFLNHLFSDVILRDHSALGSSSASVKLSFWRRLVLATAGTLGLLLLVLWIVSFAGNHTLVSTAVDASRAAQSQDVPPGQLPSADSLRRLEQVRQSLATVTDYERNGRPWRLGWGLFTGDDLYDPLYRIYFGLFRRLLLAPTQNNMVELLARPTATPDRTYIYNALKAYLITTSNHEKSTPDFLAPVLATHWLNGRPIDADRSSLAGQQFAFYADELRFKNPYPAFATPDPTAVQISRAYLKASATIEPLYQAMLAKASAQNPAFVFNKEYAGSAEVVLNSYPVPGAFTKPGWAYMQKAIQNPKEYFSGEVWVLGPDTYANLDPSRMQQDLQNRYRADFVKTWRDFLHATRVVGYSNIPDAAKKLDKLSGNQSPLLAALCVVSENTSVEKPISDLFQPPQQVVPAGCHDHLAGGSNGAYMDGLGKLLTSIQALASNPTNDTSKNDTLTSALTAQAQVRQMARNFPVDKEGAVDSTTQTLLEDPIKHVQALIAGAPAQEANAAAKSFCGQLQALLKKYPFQSNASLQATVPEVSAIFKPNDGAFWKLYQDSLKKYLVQQGSSYVAQPGTPSATPAFVNFFNRMAGASSAFFPNNAKELQIAFTVKVNPSDDVQALTLSMGSQTLRYTGGAAAPHQFIWSGTFQEVKLRVRFAGGSDFDYPSSSGLWAVFDFFNNFEKWQGTGSVATIESIAKIGNKPITVPKSGHPATVSLTVDTGNAPNIFRPQYFSSLTCVAPALH